MALSRCQNGVTKTRKVPRCVAGFRPASEFVAAIDYGTTHCSVAYTLQQESKEIFKLPIDGPHTRVPNAILIERKTNTVEAFGQRARNKFSMMKSEDREKYIYFERMKMILYRRRVSTFSYLSSTSLGRETTFFIMHEGGRLYCVYLASACLRI